MALGFFRRRQKLVMLIMAVLMVSFLIGFQGVERIFMGRSRDPVLRRTGLGPLRASDLALASNDIRLLSMLGYRLGPEFVRVLANGGQQPEVYATLLQEARSTPVSVSEVDVSDFLGAIGLGGAEYQGFMSQLRSEYSVTEHAFRDAVKNWVLIRKVYSDALTPPPASEPQLRALFRDLSEQIQIQYATVNAADFLQETAQPDEQAVQQQFDKYRNVDPGTIETADEFGFGYKQPDRVQLEYILVRQDIVTQSARPDENEMRDYYRRNRGEFNVEEQKADKPPDSTQPQAAASEEQPSDDNEKPPVRRQLTYAQAKPLIAEKLAQSTVSNRMQELLSRILTMVGQRRAQDPSTTESLEGIVGQFVKPADAVLARELAGLDYEAQPLKQVLDDLAERAGLDKIVFPLGDQGPTIVEPDIQITLKAEKITLGQALAELARQTKLDELKWVGCEGFDGAIFCREPVSTFPIKRGQTGLLSLEELSKEPLVGSAATSAGQSIFEFAFNVKDFARLNSSLPVLEVGDFGIPMEVSKPQAGMLLWRLASVKKAFVPESADQVTGGRERIVSDIRRQFGMNLAVEHAQKLKEQAAIAGLEKAAVEMGLKMDQTSFFARKGLTMPQMQMQTLVLQMMGKTELAPQTAVQIVLSEPPIRYVTPQIKELDLPEDSIRQRFVETAFQLVPSGTEPPYQDEPAMAVAKLPAIDRVFVIQRINYRPAELKQYAERCRDLREQLKVLREWQVRRSWFTLEGIEQRVGMETRIEQQD